MRETYYIFEPLGRLGRLGNQLWQVASVLGLAEKAGCPARFHQDWEYRRYFSVPEEHFELVPVGAPTQDFVDDYMQRFRDWVHIQDRIREYFAPSELSREELMLFYPEALERAPESLAVHVRLTDYKDLAHLFVQLQPEYYERAIALARVSRPQLEIMLFSDEPELARRMFPGDVHVVKPRGRPSKAQACELFLMSRCQRHVIANSTYSWWGAFLADSARVVYPDQWAYPELELYHRWEQALPDDARWLRCPVGLAGAGSGERCPAPET